MSTRDMTINQIKATDKEFGASHTIKVSGFKEPKDKVPLWFKEFYEKEFKPLRDAFIESQSRAPKWFSDFAEEQRQFNQIILSRLDNLVLKNDLKE